ncbi:MAG: ATP-binding protein [Treponema sp.]|nr:ATP-binding protein [Treponema sp.]
MAKLRVKNFGPIKEGFSENDGFMEIRKATVFIGEQGAGKSTVAKLYSTFLWLEKAFFCGFDIPSDFSAQDFIKLCSNQLIPDFYFSAKTDLKYIGDYCHFSLDNEKFTIEFTDNEKYTRPKIMYIPSERNLVSVLENVDELKRLPTMLDLLQKEIRKAKKGYIPNITESNRTLFLDKYSIKYDSSADSIIVTEKESNVSVPLNMSSSGLQSVIPLMLVTDFLGLEVEKSVSEKLRNLSPAERDSILNSIADESIVKNIDVFFTSGLRTKNLEEKLEDNIAALNKYINMRFINIVEEPEQNLYPDYQKKIVESLVLHANQSQGNQLLITTHSPYVLGVLNNCIYAGNLTKQGKNTSGVIPLNHQIPVENASAYKIENGKIRSIISDDLHLINNSEIDGCSEMINADYQKLEDIEFA